MEHPKSNTIVIDAKFGLPKDFLGDLLKNNPTVVTSDYDDTLVEKTGKYALRLKMFKSLAEAPNTKFLVVTSRDVIDINDSTCLSPRKPWDNILQFLQNNNINAHALIFNAGDKAEILDQLKTVCHFEDDIFTVLLCLKKGIPIWFTGEYLDVDYQKAWFDVIEKEAMYYPNHSINRLETIRSLGVLM